MGISKTYINKHLTLCITTFLRPYCCIRLLESVRKYYPEINILLCDDSKSNWHWAENKHIRVINAPFDIGVSAKRNLLASQVKTKYLLYLDDDFIFTELTSLERWLEYFKKHKMNILSCRLNDDLKGWQGTFGLDSYGRQVATAHWKKDLGEVQLYDFTANPIIIDTKTALKYTWNNKQKLGEHLEFYVNIAAQGKNVKIGHTQLVSILHNHDFTNIHDYRKYRNRHNEFEKQWRPDNNLGLVQIGKIITEQKLRTGLHIKYTRNGGQIMDYNNIDADWIEQNVTICIKTFLRPDCCIRLIDSIRKYYPKIKILLCEDSAMEWNWIEDENTRVYYAPYDIGISAGRNMLQSQVMTDYLMPVDDDFVFTEHTDLVKMAKLLIKHKLDIITCKYDDRTPISYQGQVDFHNGFIELQNNIMKEDLGDCQLWDYINMPPLMSTEFALKYRWNQNVKMGEHSEYYIRLKDISNRSRKKFRFGRTTDCSILHLHQSIRKDYQPFRDRADEYRLTWTDKYNDEEHQGRDVRYYRNIELEENTERIEKPKVLIHDQKRFLFVLVFQMYEKHIMPIILRQLQNYLLNAEINYHIISVHQEKQNYGEAYNTAVSIADNYDAIVLYDPYLVPVRNVLFWCNGASQVYGSPNSSKGIFCVSKSIYEQCNGYSNRYCDDNYVHQDFIERLRKEGILPDRSNTVKNNSTNICKIGGKVPMSDNSSDKGLFNRTRHLSTYTEDGLEQIVTHIKTDKTDGNIRRIEI